MSTIITQAREVFPFRKALIKNPSAKMMLVEEDRATIDDSRWVPEGDKPNWVTPRHGGKGNVIFADFHGQAVTPEFGADPANSMPEH